MSIELADFNVMSYSGTGSFSVDSGGLHITNNKYLKSSDYIIIRPDIYTFRYDIVLSASAGNRFYLGWERYDANKTSRSNDACIYVVSILPTADQTMVRYRGTVDLSTDGVNPCKFIRLRILNLWTGSTAEEGTATIHALNLLGVQANESNSVKAYRNGEFTGDHFQEFPDEKVSIQRIGHINSSILYEY